MKEGGASAGEAGLLFTDSGASFTESMRLGVEHGLGAGVGGAESSGVGRFGGNPTSILGWWIL